MAWVVSGWALRKPRGCLNVVVVVCEYNFDVVKETYLGKELQRNKTYDVVHQYDDYQMDAIVPDHRYLDVWHGFAGTISIMKRVRNTHQYLKREQSTVHFPYYELSFARTFPLCCQQRSKKDQEILLFP